MCKNYGARISPWGSPLAVKGQFWTFQNGQNPGGDLEIWDIFPEGVCTLMDNAEWVSIFNSTIFGNKIFLKFRIFIGGTEISRSKFLTLPLPQIARRAYAKSNLGVSKGMMTNEKVVRNFVLNKNHYDIFPQAAIFGTPYISLPLILRFSSLKLGGIYRGYQIWPPGEK